MPLPRDLHGIPELRVTRQLAEAMLYEGLVRYTSQPAGNHRRFEWALDGVAIRCEGSVGAFGRVRIDPETIEAGHEGGWLPATVDDLVASIDACGERSKQLSFELSQTLSFIAWNRDNLKPAVRRGLPYPQLDGALDEGHPYHPSFKARTGFTHEDHAAYGPEAGNAFQLAWLAVAPQRLHCAFPMPEPEFWMREFGGETYALLAARRAACADESFGLVPLHPWQWSALKEAGLSAWLEDGTAHFLGFAGDRYIASQSVRTLFNLHHPERANIKLPMNLVNSSAKRIIEPHSVCTAPLLTRWLKQIVAADPLFTEAYPLTILGEYAGIVADRDGPLAGEIAVIWRESVCGKLQPGQQAVPLNALMTVENDGRPFIADWIERHSIEAWVAQFIEVAVMPIWHLLVAHGIATESHGQNLILIHRDGWPVGLVLRDFHDSLEYEPGFLRDAAAAPDFARLNPAYATAEPNEYYWMESVELLGELVVDALFVYNIAEISHLLEHCYGFDEARFWAAVGRHLTDYAEKHALAERQTQLGIDRPRIRTESLLTRKLSPAGAVCAHEIPNSLAIAA